MNLDTVFHLYIQEHLCPQGNQDIVLIIVLKLEHWHNELTVSEKHRCPIRNNWCCEYKSAIKFYKDFFSNNKAEIKKRPITGRISLSF